MPREKAHRIICFRLHKPVHMSRRSGTAIGSYLEHSFAPDSSGDRTTSRSCPGSHLEANIAPGKLYKAIELKTASERQQDGRLKRSSPRSFRDGRPCLQALRERRAKLLALLVEHYRYHCYAIIE